MTSLVDLSPAHLTIVVEILAEHVPACEVRAFGSRAMWNARDTSDLDLAVIGDGPLPSRILTMLKETFEESRLPMRVDVIDWNAITDDFRESIASDSVVVQEAPERADWSTVALGDVVVPTLGSVDKKSKASRRVVEAEHAVLVDGSGGHHGDAWPVRSIQDMCLRVTSGGTPSRRQPSFYEDGCWPWLKTQELRDGWLDDSEEHITDDAVASSSAKVLPENTVLMAMYGATVGQLGILRRPMTCNQACCAMIVDPGRADCRYLFYQLLHARPWIRNLATGAAQQNLSGRLIKSLKFPFPPLPEQRRIARVLGMLDDNIELNRRMSKTLEEMARALFKSWFVDFDPVRAKAKGQPSGLPPDLDTLFPASFEASELGAIPAGWEVIPAGEVMKVYGGSTPSTKEPKYWGGEHHFATPKDLSMLQAPVLVSTARRLTDAGVARIRSGLLPPRTVLLSSRAPIGYLALTETQVAINQGIVAMVCDGPIGALYALHWSYSNMLAIEARSSGTTFPEISKSSFREVPLLVPTEPVHAAWEALVTPLYNQIASNVHQAHSLTEQRDVLLPRLISGAVRLSPRGDR